jgi:hypothetical protein
MIITDQGLIGIGTSDPEYELSVFGSISSDSVIYASGGNNSLDWGSVYTDVRENSASWISTYTDVYANSASWDSVITDVAANSASWISVNTDVNANSSVWDSVATDVNANSSVWDSVAADVYANSASWMSTHTDVYANSASWVSTNTDVYANSASWDSTNTTLYNISGSSWFHSTSAGSLGRHITSTHDLTAGMAARQNIDGSWVRSVAASLPVNGLDTDVLSAEVLGIVQASNAVYGYTSELWGEDYWSTYGFSQVTESRINDGITGPQNYTTRAFHLDQNSNTTTTHVRWGDGTTTSDFTKVTVWHQGYAGSWAVKYSDDNDAQHDDTWTTVATFDNISGPTSETWDSVGAHKYWALFETLGNPANNNSDYQEVQFYSGSATVWSGSNFEIIYSGICNLPSHEFGEPGQTIFLSPTTLGKLTTACVTSDYQVDKPVGTILDDDTILVQPFRGVRVNPMPNNEDDWISTATTVYENSGAWGSGTSTTDTLNANSGLWKATYTTVHGTSSQWDTAHDDRLKWDGGSTGLNAGTGRTSLGLGTIATQAAGSVDIDGGAIDGTTVGAAAASTGKFTTLTVTAPGTAPADSTATGTKGQIVYDDNYIYICVATNTWKRSPIATW